MDAFLSVILEVAVILILILVGYFTVKKGMFTKESLGSITSFLLYIVTPCLIVSSFLSAESGKLDGWTLLLAAVLPALSIVISIALSYLFFRKEPSGRRRVLRFSMIFCNVGFMGVPLVEGIVGSEGVLYGSFFIAVFNIFCWTYGYVMMGGGKVRLKALLLNPGVIGIVIGLPLYLLDVPVPALFVEPVELISALNTPLAMIVVGGYIAQVKLRAFVSDLAVYKMAVLRLVVAPLLYLALVWLLRPDETLLMSTVIQAATPVAANCVLFAVQYDSDAELASKSVAVSTALSVVTIPLLTVLVQALL
ncbi:MAG TPA: AEC family transporter [Candidatus Ruminococcus gallistercoris]|nr:AEC family transporter [Candidatus Ruminococcus gallistercoris]